MGQMPIVSQSWDTSQTWRADAACTGWSPASENDSDPFFEAAAKAQRKAAEYCKELCPVLQHCGAWALKQDQQYGVWGGMTERDRQKLKKRLKALKEAHEARAAQAVKAVKAVKVAVA